MRVYAHLSCIVTIENGYTGPWNAAVGIKMLSNKNIHPTLPKNRDVMLQFFLRLCNANNRFTCREGVLGVHGVPTKYAKVSQKNVDYQNNGMAIRSHGGRTHSVQQKSNRECMSPMQILQAKFTRVSLSK
jgi:hypothetical protein